MPNSVRRAIMAILFLAAVSGWAAAAVLVVRVAVPASASDPAIAVRASSYVSSYVSFEAGTKPFEQVSTYLTGSALDALTAEKAAGAAAVPGLALDGAVQTTVLWRQGDQALVEVSFTLSDATSTSTPVGEHLLLVLRDGAWKVDSIWRIAPDPGTPLVPAASEEPTASPAP